MAFSDNAAERARFGKQFEEVLKVDNAIRESKDADRNLSFKKLLENLGVAVPAEMSEAEAAAEFLRHIEAARNTLAQLNSTLEVGPWDWGEYRPDDAEMSRRRWDVCRMLQAASNLDSGIIQAHWRAGDSDAAWNDWELMRLLSLRAGEGGNLMGILFEGSLQAMRARMVSTGIELGGWTDAQLAQIPDALAPFDALDSMVRGLDGENRHLDDLSRRPGDVRALFERIEDAGPGHSGSFVRRLAIGLTTDQQLKDNLAIIAADYQFARSRFDFEKRVYLAPAVDEPRPFAELRDSASFFTGLYFLPLTYLGAGFSEENSISPTLPSNTIRSQAANDQARLAAALEMQRRATGEYPESLAAVAPVFPGGIPHDLATGQPYSYERSADGVYKLWGAGIDQTNDSGDPKKDTPFAAPRIRTQ
jgi:hypothetical protein